MFRSRYLILVAALALTLTACGDGEADPDETGGEDAAESEDAGDGADAEEDDDAASDSEGEDEDAQSDDEGSAEATGAPEVTDITVGILPTPDYAPVVIAVEEGYFEEEGLNVETTVMAPGQAVPGIVGGTYHFGGVNWITFVLSVNTGVDLHPVIELDRGVPDYAQVLVLNDSDIETVEDLVGRDVAVVATPGNCDVIPLDAMQQAGAEGSANFVNFSIPDMPGALSRGDVDAACVPQPTLGETLESGDFRSVIDIFEDEYEGFPIVGMSTSQEFADQNPNTVAAFQRALERGAQEARDDDNAVRQVLPLYTNFTEEQADVVTLPEYPVGLEQDRLELTTEIMNRVGIFEEDLSVPQLD